MDLAAPEGEVHVGEGGDPAEIFRGILQFDDGGHASSPIPAKSSGSSSPVCSIRITSPRPLDAATRPCGVSTVDVMPCLLPFARLCRLHTGWTSSSRRTTRP